MLRYYDSNAKTLPSFAFSVPFALPPHCFSSSNWKDPELTMEPMHESDPDPDPQYSLAYRSGDTDSGDSAPVEVSPDSLELDLELRPRDHCPSELERECVEVRGDPGSTSTNIVFVSVTI
jgi:hypothetical protein